MSKPEVYPFLRIAKQYDVDYSDVLYAADALRLMEPRNTSLSDEVCAAIVEAHNEQELIRQGMIDWMTGELCDEPRTPLLN